jgi:hypothetical protein
MKRAAFVLLAFLAATGPGLATTFQFTLENHSQSDITKFFIRNGEIEGSTRVPAGGKSTVKVTLPDGTCKAKVHVDFADPYYIDDDKSVDLCKYNGLTIR